MIVIVDDDTSMREALQRLLASTGYQAVAFGSAEDVLNFPKLHETACIVSDVQMPGMSGIDLQARLTAQEQRIPFIFVTAYADDAIRERALKAGAVGFLSKPFECAKLIECIEKAREAS